MAFDIQTGATERGEQGVGYLQSSLRDLQDQLNSTATSHGVTGTTFPSGLVNGSMTHRAVADGIALAMADEKGSVSQEFTIRRNLVESGGVTTSAAAPTTDDLPRSGVWGWHYNSATTHYYFALNHNGVVVYPAFESIAGTLQPAQHGDQSATFATQHAFTQISGVISGAQHGDQSNTFATQHDFLQLIGSLSLAQHGNFAGQGGTQHDLSQISGSIHFSDIIGSISAAQHGSQTATTLHAAATTGGAGFMSAGDKSKLTDITDNTTSSAYGLSGTGLWVGANRVVSSRGAAVADALTGGSATAANCASVINTLKSRLESSTGHGLITG